jgi:hypothetical protein
MLKANTGTSIQKAARAAGIEAAKKAAQGLTGIKFAFVYGSCDYAIHDMLAGVQEALPGIPVAGNTSFTGIITPEGYVTGPDGFVGIMALADENLVVGTATVARGSGSAAEDGRKAAQKAMQAAGQTTPPDYFYMAASPAEEELYLKGISAVIGRVPMFGGSAADNTITGKWQLYSDKGVCPDGVALAFFYTKKKIHNIYTGAYRETGDRGIITKVRDLRTLVEIDGEPALKKYAGWRGIPVDKLMGGALLGEAVLSPIGVKDRLGDLVAIRHPMHGNEDYSMAIGNNLAEGTAVIRMEATVDELIDATGDVMQTLKAKAPQAGAYHLVHCGGRRAGIGERINEVAEQMVKEAGGVPFIAEFTFGEYGFVEDGRNTCGGLMLSFTALDK